MYLALLACISRLTVSQLYYIAISIDQTNYVKEVVKRFDLPVLIAELVIYIVQWTSAQGDAILTRALPSTPLLLRCVLSTTLGMH